MSDYAEMTLDINGKLVNGVIAIDVDNTVMETDGHPDYENPRATPGALEFCNKLVKMGYKIDFFTARSHDYYAMTHRVLTELGFKFRRLIVAKPFADYYIDDRAIRYDPKKPGNGFEQILKFIEGEQT